MLEEGNIEGAEEQKQRIEQLQRERRKVLQDNNMIHQPRFFKYATGLLICVYVRLCVSSLCLKRFLRGGAHHQLLSAMSVSINSQLSNLSNRSNNVIVFNSTFYLTW